VIMARSASPAPMRKAVTVTGTAPLPPAGRPGHAGMTYPAEILSLEEVERLFGAASARSSSGLRIRALILVMQRCGLRVAEALALRPLDIDFDDATVRGAARQGRQGPHRGPRAGSLRGGGPLDGAEGPAPDPPARSPVLHAGWP
jgi:integrase